MLPVLTKPLLQYGVEEAISAGMDTMAIVTGRGKRAIEDHFDRSYELENQINGTSKESLMTEIRTIVSDYTFSYTRQVEMKGLGHAILSGETLIGENPFAVVLADDLCDSDAVHGSVLSQMVKLYEKFKCSIVAIEEVPKEETSKYTALKKTGKAIQHFYANEVNSTVVTPSPEKPWTDLKDGDVVEIEGLAWSGMGTITGVDLSFDGGKNYVETKLKGLALPKSWTRWSYMHTYKKGDTLLLTSRAMDDAGYIQPTIDQEVSIMGVESVYHRNAVETWEVTKTGKVNHVQVRS